MPAGGHLANGTGHEPDAELIALDLCRNANAPNVLRFRDLIAWVEDGRNHEKIIGFFSGVK